MAFEQEEEEFEFGSVFQDDDDDEDYAEPSEFRDYSEEEVESKWGNFSFEDLVFELENILGTSKKYFFSKKKRVVDAEQMVNLTKLISSKIPDEITRARGIIEEEQRIISSAKRNAKAVKADADSYHARTIQEADSKAAGLVANAKAKSDQIVAGAQAQAKETIARADAQAKDMVAEHTITRQARDKSVEIIEEARQKSREIIDMTNAECEEYVGRIMSWADTNINGVNNYVYGLLGSARDTYQSSISNIDAVRAKYKSDFEAQVASLKKVPKHGKKQQN